MDREAFHAGLTGWEGFLQLIYRLGRGLQAESVTQTGGHRASETTET